MPLVTIGRRLPENARRYGWGYSPGEPIIVEDPDSGRTYVDAANNHGWRDRDRSFDNPSRAFRILVLGDSVTFGPVVSAEAVYTRVLEDRLRREGYAAEVINIAYGGWGTDQELEALHLEGTRYRPDLVVLQFTTNDVTDNEADSFLGNVKPFVYRLDAAGRLIRHENPALPRPSLKDYAKALVVRSEVLKHVYRAYRTIRASHGQATYRVGSHQLAQLKIVLGMREDDPLTRFLAEHLGRPLDAGALGAAVERSPVRERRDIVFRIAEDRWFHEYWTEDDYRPRPPDPGSAGWRLLFALVEAIQAEAGAVGAPLALVTDNEDGAYEWERYWYRIAPDEASRAAFLAPTVLLREFAAGHGIGFVEPELACPRARNDSHPNIEGNAAMAENLYRHLMRHHRAVLERHRRR
ncbi:MAG TPA: SGNH/GDSL hydrolase family protein [Methylomirabilota bacterium]|nr:SGNH/GDSL hydrolase family protein [Methylomirabilota bacterium]